MDYEGKNVVITGGARGIGYEIANQMLIKGAESMAIIDILKSTEEFRKLKMDFPKKNILYFIGDVSKKEDVEKAFKEINKQFKSIDIVVGNAGIVNDQNVNLTINVNILGIINTTFVAMEYMNKRNNGKGGIIANVASVLGLQYFFSIPVYTASKHAVIGFTRTMADSYYEYMGIKFMTICPGFTSTVLIEKPETWVLHPDSTKDTLESIKEYIMQTPKQAGISCANTIALGENGSIWIIEGGNQREIKLTTYWP